MKILVISLAGIGDTLFATPLIHELRENFPTARIDALVLWAGSRDVLENNPHLNRVHQKNLIAAGTTDALRFLWHIHKNHYDISINTHPQSRIHYRLVAWFIDARLRVSHRYDNSTPFDRVLVNRTLQQDYDRHSIDNNLALLRLLGASPRLQRHDYELYFTAAEQEWAEQFIVGHGIKDRPWLGIHVGSGGTKNLALRRWPVSSYLELIKKLNENFRDLMVLLFGGPEEVKDNEAILAQVDQSRVIPAGTKNLRQAAALLRHCAAFLSVDTALMHLAAAMKVANQIVIETPTWNKPIQPYNQPFTLIKNPGVGGRNLEFYRYDGKGIRGTGQQIINCMLSVSVDSVYEAIASRLLSMAANEKNSPARSTTQR